MIKRIFDFVLALFLLIAFFWLLFISWIIAALDTRSNGIFIQERIGRFGIFFKIYKLQTIKETVPLYKNKISTIGRFLRKYKLDELPQLFNILKGEMSFVGPRPDIAGYYDQLVGEQKKILELKPGLTSAASLKYHNEEELLKTLDSPLDYNDRILFPDKVKMNLTYYYTHTFFGDVLIILKTGMFIIFKRG